MPDRSGFALNAEQQQRLLALRAAWEEGEDEERLERLRLREEDAETVRAFAQILQNAGVADGGRLTHSQTVRLLTLARALAPNPNLDARLLRQPGEPEAFQQDLRELLFGKSTLALRLRGFLTRRHAGGQTALQLLCAHAPEEWPLITQAGLRALELSPDQQHTAMQAARIRFDLPAEIVGVEAYSNSRVHLGVPDNDPILRLLADIVVYTAVRELLEASDYLTVHRLLTRGLSLKSGRGRRMSAALLYPPTTLSVSSTNAASSGRNQAVAEPSALTRNGSQNAAGDITASEQSVVRESDQPEYLTGNEWRKGAKGTEDEEEKQKNSEERRKEERKEEEKEREELSTPIDLSGYTQHELLVELERYVQAQGFTYPSLTVRGYYLALQSKPFVLLSGLSGTGKTRLTSLFAEALTGNVSAQYRLLPVRPDWADSTPLLGYVNLLVPGTEGRGRFVSTPFLDFVERAARTENAPRAFFLCLDEMNLARVEHYFAEVLSAMETQTRELLLPGGRVLRLPANLFIAGTLNLDESTHSLSRKVLDRANTLSFHEVRLREDAVSASPSEVAAAQLTAAQSEAALGEAEAEKGEGLSAAQAIPWGRLTPAIRQALFLRSRVEDAHAARAKLRRVSTDGADFAARIVNILADINAVLEPHGLHFAYRVRDETLRYCANSFDVDGRGLLQSDSPEDNLHVALDLQLVQKILPRLTGTQEQLEPPVRELLRYLEQSDFEQTTHRLYRLLSRLQRNGFAVFDE